MNNNNEFKDLRTPDGCLFASAAEIEHATAEERRDIYIAFHEAVHEFSRI